MSNAVSNEAFITEIFGNAPTHAVPWVTGFAEDPLEASGKQWGGAPVTNGALPWMLGDHANNFMAISTFRKASDGRYHRRKENFAACHLIMVDDVGSKIGPWKIPIEPSYKLETSPENFQYGYILAEPVTDRALVDRVIQAMIDQGLATDGKDPGMKGVTRYGRLPVGRNTKQKYIDRLGAPFIHQLEEWRPERRFTLQEIIDAFELDLDEVRSYEYSDTDDPILKDIKEKGLYKGPVSGKPGVHDITCPFITEHGDRADSGAAYFQPHFDGRDKPGFKCHHGHCEKRTIKDVLRFLNPREAVPEKGNGKTGKKPERASLKWVVKLLQERGGFVYDTFLDTPLMDNRPFNDRWDVGELRLWFGEQTGVPCGKDLMRDALDVIFGKHQVDSLRNWFDELEPWDGTERLDRWLSDTFEIDQTEYLKLIGPAWMKSGVARVYEPGCKVRGVLLPSGPEDVGKSQCITDICPKEEWRTDSLPDLHDKHAPEALFGRFVVELPEMAAMKRSYREAVKNFLGKECDDYLAKYERSKVKHYRRCIFAATSNDDDILNSLDDNTRFWPFLVKAYNRDYLLDNKLQLWAEAKHRYQAGEKWYFTGLETRNLIAKHRLQFVETHPWDEEIGKWLSSMAGRSVTTTQALEHLLIDPQHQTRAQEMIIAGIFKKFEWIKVESKARPRKWVKK
jgi:hypothetical protein